MADNLLSPNPETLGLGNTAPTLPGPQGPDAYTQAQAKLKRQQDTPLLDKAGAIWRQDGVVDGLLSTLVEKTQFKPDPTFNPWTDPGAKQAEDGILPDMRVHLYDATSAAHREWIRMRLLQKQEDQQKLSDLTGVGEVGRFALNAAFPENYVAGFGAGLFTKGLRLLEAGKALAPIQQAAAGAAERAAQTGTALVTKGVAFGAAENAAIEAVRQRVNYESDTSGIVAAGLMGAAFTSPFVLAGAHSQGRVAAAAAKELEFVTLLQKASQGSPLTHAEALRVRDSNTIHQSIKELEAGRITPDEFHARTAEPMGPYEPADVWMERYGRQVKADADAIIADVFPGSTGRATGRPPLSAPQRAASDEAVRLETLINFPDKAPGSPAEPLNAMQLAFQRAKQAAGLKAPDLSALDAAAAATKKAQTDAAWSAHIEGLSGAKKADQEAMIRARELHDMVAEDSNTDRPRAPRSDTPAAPEMTHGAAPAAHPLVDQHVTWLDRAGVDRAGVVPEVRPDGFLNVRTEDGIKVVHHTKTDQFQAHMGDSVPAPAGFLHGSVGAAQVTRIVGVWEQRTAAAAARFDYFSILNGSKSLGVRELVFKLAKDAIRVDKEEAQGWTASEYKKDLQRRIGGQFHVTLKQAEREAVKLAGVKLVDRPAFLEEFRSLVSRETRGDWTVRANLNQQGALHYPAVQKAAGAMKQAFTAMLEEAQRLRVKGALDVPANDLYTNRVWNHNAIRDAMEKHGGDTQLVNLIARAINVPGHIGDRVKAKSFLDTIRKLEFENQTATIHLQGRDMAVVRHELKAKGLTDAEVNNFVDVMFDAREGAGGDKGQAANLKFRFDIDENAAVTLPTGVLRISDLLQNDPRVLVDSYTNAMGGQIGLAKVGIDSSATFEAKLRAISQEALDKGHDGAKLASELQMLRDIHANITGKPMSGDSNSTTARMAQSFRALTRAATLGQLGIVATFEMFKAASMMGIRAVWQSLPAFRDLITALRQGFVPSTKLANDIMAISGFGSELAHSYTAKHDIVGGWGSGEGLLTRFEAFSNQASHLVDHISGNASVTSVSRSVAAQAATRQAFEFASGKVLPAKLRERWVSQGLDANEIDVVLKDLKDHAQATGGHLDGIDYEKWQKAEPETYDKFKLFISRQAREAIQDQDIGETMPWMHSTLGKVFAELRTFMLVGHAKNFLKNTVMKDQTAFNVWMFGLVAETLAYSLQSAANAPGELDKRLSFDQMARAIPTRMASMGAMPLLWGTVYGWTTGEDWTKPGYTANTDSRSLLKTASFNELVRLGNLPQTLTGLVGAHPVVRKDIAEGFRGMPGARVLGMPLLAEQLGNFFPKSDQALLQQR